MKSSISEGSALAFAFMAELRKACENVERAVPSHRTVEVALYAEYYTPGFALTSSAEPKGHRLGANVKRIVTVRQSMVAPTRLLVCYGDANKFDRLAPRVGQVAETEFVATSPKVRRINAESLAKYLATGSSPVQSYA